MQKAESNIYVKTNTTLVIDFFINNESLNTQDPALYFTKPHI